MQAEKTNIRKKLLRLLRILFYLLFQASGYLTVTIKPLLPSPETSYV